VSRAGVPGQRPHVERVVVVGAGMAGGRFVDEVLAREAAGRSARTCRLTLVGAEPYGPYNRVLLSDVVADRADVAALTTADPQVLAERGVDVRLGVDVTRIDRAAGTVVLSDGDAVPFDRVVLATGADPVVPPVEGLGRGPGVHVLRTLDDAREIVAGTRNARTALVLGGGLLGLEAARGLARRGLDVRLLHAGPHLLDGVLDAAGGTILARALRRLGVTVRCSARTVAAWPAPGADRFGGLVLDDGTRPAADLLVVACGVRPRTRLAVEAGLHVGRGVRVGDDLATSDARILAVGDCAEHRGVTGGLVAPAWEQAAVAADLVTGARPAARYGGRTAAVRLKAADVEVVACGESLIDPWGGDGEVEVVQLLEPARGRYVKAVVRAGIVVGAAVVGDARAGADLALLVERSAPAPPDRTALVTAVRGRAGAADDDPTLLPDRVTICRCNGVTKGEIVRAWTAGARSVDAVAAATRAGTGCGSCRDATAGIVGWLAAADPAPDPLPGPPAGPGSHAPARTTTAPHTGGRR